MTESELIQEALRLWREESQKPEPKYMRREPAKPIHGTANGYRYHGCRCDDCRKAHREQEAQMRADRKRRMEEGTAVFEHGQSGYRNWACRCNVCSEAHAERERQRWLRTKNKER